MKTSARWIFFFGAIGILILGVYYFAIPSSLFWPPYSTMGWRPYYFGPRIFPSVSLLGLLIAFIIGFAFYKLLFPSSGSRSAEEEKDFCPFCGRDLRGSESISSAHPEDLGKKKV
jgi:hypothetical protein